MGAYPARSACAVEAADQLPGDGVDLEFSLDTPPARVRELRPERRRAEHARQRLGQCVGVTGRHQDPGTVLEQLGDAADGGRDHRHAIRHRLDQGHAESFVKARQHHAIRSSVAVHPQQLRVRDGAQEPDVVAQPSLADAALDRRALGALTREPELERDPARHQPCRRLEQVAVALDGGEPRRAEQHGRRARRHVLGGGGWERDAHVHHHRPGEGIRRDQRPGHRQHLPGDEAPEPRRAQLLGEQVVEEDVVAVRGEAPGDAAHGARAHGERGGEVRPVGVDVVRTPLAGDPREPDALRGSHRIGDRPAAGPGPPEAPERTHRAARRA